MGDMQKIRKPRTKSSIPEEFQFKELDIYQLHEEWKTQDNMIGYYSRKSADAKLEYERAKTARDVYEAETSRRIRRKPKNYNVGRLTEAAIKEVVAIEVLSSESHEHAIKVKHKLDIIEAALKRLEHRKKGLTDLVFLHSQGYFAQHSVPKRYKKKGDERDFRVEREDDDD